MAEDSEKEAEGTGGGGINKTAVAIIVGVAAVGGIALAYFFDLVSDPIVGGLISGGFALLLALLVARVAFETIQPALRYGMFVFILASAFVALYPASEALHLGRPSASAVLSEANRTLVLPSAGDYRVLVSGHLEASREGKIGYRVKAGDQAFEGALTREFATRRARRGAAIQVPEDHDLQAHETAVTGAPAVLTLESITGAPEVLLQAFRVIPQSVIWAVMLVVLLVGMFLESKHPANGTLVMSGTAAVVYGLIIKTATPTSMASATLWGTMLAAGGGAIGGSILNVIAKKVFGSASDPVDRAKGKPANKGEDKEEE